MPIDSTDESERRPGAGFAAALTALYLACVAVATWPAVTRFRSSLPGGYVDPYQHLWLMKWHRTCLLEGRSPLVCPDLQYPAGAPIGLFSPLHLQSLMFIPLTLVVKDDVLGYNLAWTAALVTTGLGTAALAWRVVRHRVAAGFAGMLAILATPTLLHAHEHLELITLGGFPVFLHAWLRFVDRPTRGRQAAATVAYLLLAMSAAYFAVFAVFPSAWYAAWSWARSGRGARSDWLRARAGRLATFAAVAGLGALALFSGQVWAARQGAMAPRSGSEFARYGTPPWSYLLPTELHPLSEVMPFNPYALARVPSEGWSYLGVVTLGLLYVAATRRARFADAGYWWSATLLLVVLSLGASCRIGSREVPLPAGWIRDHGLLFRFIRVPARFNLFVGVLAAVLAAAGLKHRLGAIRRPLWRGALVSGMAAVALLDLAQVPYAHDEPPAMPPCYEAIRREAPHAAILEVPHCGYAGAERLAAATGYWQSIHGLKTSGGYSGHANVPADDLATYASPFWTPYLRHPGVLEDLDKVRLDMAVDVRYRDYVWLYLKAHRFDYIVVHRWQGSRREPLPGLARAEGALREALSSEDAAAAVYDASRLSPPTRPVLACTRGWLRRGRWRGRHTAAASRRATITAYDPEPGRDLTFLLDAAALDRPRAVRLLLGETELARWEVPPGEFRLQGTTIRLPAGLVELTLESDGEARPSHRRDLLAEGDRTPYSLRVIGLALKPAGDLAAGSGGRAAR